MTGKVVVDDGLALDDLLLERVDDLLLDLLRYLLLELVVVVAAAGTEGGLLVLGADPGVLAALFRVVQQAGLVVEGGLAAAAAVRLRAWIAKRDVSQKVK